MPTTSMWKPREYSATTYGASDAYLSHLSDGLVNASPPASPFSSVRLESPSLAHPWRNSIGGHFVSVAATFSRDRLQRRQQRKSQLRALSRTEARWTNRARIPHRPNSLFPRKRLG